MVVGLEVLVQLRTKSKAFCGCSTDFGSAANTNTCPVCLALPGSLPVLNAQAVTLATRAAIALGCTINPTSIFARKNYFYPDLPKGYQISQYDRALARGGYMDVPLPGDDGAAAAFRVTIPTTPLEEDAGKTKNEADRRLIDFNRCGVPLVEMVTGPDLHSADEAAQYLIRLR